MEQHYKVSQCKEEGKRWEREGERSGKGQTIKDSEVIHLFLPQFIIIIFVWVAT